MNDVRIHSVRRAVRAGVATIEHGAAGDADVFALMKENGVALCPTLAVPDAILQYGGWRKGVDPEPERIQQKRASFRAALEIGWVVQDIPGVGTRFHKDGEVEGFTSYIVFFQEAKTGVAVLANHTQTHITQFGNDLLSLITAGRQ